MAGVSTFDGCSEECAVTRDGPPLCAYMDFNEEGECWLAPTCEGHASPSNNLIAEPADNAGIMQRESISSGLHASITIPPLLLSSLIDLRSLFSLLSSLARLSLPASACLCAPLRHLCLSCARQCIAASPTVWARHAKVLLSTRTLASHTSPHATTRVRLTPAVISSPSTPTTVAGASTSPTALRATSTPTRRCSSTCSTVRERIDRYH